MSRADAALDLIANLALAGVAAAIVVRPEVVSRSRHRLFCRRPRR